ncbi:MAG TPA: twin-arginine translocase TatA/TatE family subunit [Nitrospirae bacterium]|nr:twin-arginine translocase TatA/TatE family subunit [Nitrospirota bacterium]
MFDLGFPELLVVLVIALVIFGPSRLPSLGSSIGHAIRGFKKAINEGDRDENSEIEK